MGTKHGLRARRLAGCVALLALTGTIAACGGSKSGSGGTDSGGSAAAGKPTMGGSIVYGLEAETNGGFCLAESQLALSGIQVARAVYDTLTIPDKEGVAKPNLAESITPNATFDKWKIKLRSGVKFHDGTALDATVVKNNLDAYRGKYPARKPLLFVFVFQNIADVKVVDPLTVEVDTAKPWPALPAFLYSSGRLGIMGQAQLDAKDDCNKKMVGTGPFKLVDWTENQSLTVERNADYWMKDADGNQLPYLDKIEFRPIPDTTKRKEALVAGEIDMTHLSGGEVMSEIQPSIDDGTLSKVQNEDFSEVYYLMFNESKPPFNNKNARMAVAQAVDRESWNKVRTLGLQTIASGPFAKPNIGYLEDAGAPKFDLDAAKKAAAAYEKETGEKLSFTLSGAADSSVGADMELIQSMLGDAGIEMKIAQADQAKLIDQAIAGEFQANIWRNHPGGDPDTQYVWWYSSSIVNFGRVKDPVVDKLLDEGRAESDAAKRKTIYEDLNRQFSKEVHDVWLVWTLRGIVGDPTVQGVFGPDLPDGSKPFEGLGAGHPVVGLYVAK